MRQTAFEFELAFGFVFGRTTEPTTYYTIRSNEKIRITIPHVAVVHTKCHFVPQSYQNATGRASIVGTCQEDY